MHVIIHFNSMHIIQILYLINDSKITKLWTQIKKGILNGIFLVFLILRGYFFFKNPKTYLISKSIKCYKKADTSNFLIENCIFISLIIQP